jgi:hypothetical protein
VSFRDHPPNQHRRRNLAKKPILWTADTFCHARRFIDRPFLLAVVIICIVAAIEGYQVSISLFGGFRFEPARASQIAPEFPKAYLPRHPADESLKQQEAL